MGSVLKLAFNKNALTLREANSIVEKFLSINKNRRSYKVIWKIFSDWVSNPEIQIAQITPLFLEEFFNVFSQRFGYSSDKNIKNTVSARTLQCRFFTLKSIFNVIINEADLNIKNPLNALVYKFNYNKYIERRPNNLIPFNKVIELINAPDITTKKGLRDRCILAVIIGGALRISEALSLKVGDCQIIDNTYYLSLYDTKNKNQIKQPLAHITTPILQNYIELRIKEGAKENSYLFINYKGDSQDFAYERSPSSDAFLYRVRKLYYPKCNINIRVTLHSLRATVITKLLEDGIPPREVKEFSRHKSYQSLEIYDKKKDELATRVANKLSF